MVIVCTVMAISVLGPLRLSSGSRQVPLPAKQAILLAILALQPNRTVSTDRLIEALWGEDASPDLVKTLHTHVFQLRRRLEPGTADIDDAATVVTEGRGYRLEAQLSAIDASVFLGLVADARALAGTDPAQAAALLARPSPYGAGRTWPRWVASRRQPPRSSACRRSGRLPSTSSSGCGWGSARPTRWSPTCARRSARRRTGSSYGRA